MCDNMKTKLIPVIISGGAGIRLWPESTKDNPKPFLVLDKNDGKSLLQKTFERALAVTGSEHVYIGTNKNYHEKTLSHLSSCNCKTSLHFVLEGAGRNTAPAIILAALELNRRFGPQCTMLVLPADHLISDVDALRDAVGRAHVLAENGYLVTFGVKPAYPETGYGYIKTGKQMEATPSFEVERFVEKPNKKSAQEYVASGAYLWNSGMFCFNVERFLKEVQKFDSPLYQKAVECFEQGTVGKDSILFEGDSMNSLPSISIDCAVMEKSNKVATVICDFEWSDVGTWNAIADLGTKDENNNVTEGDVRLLESKNCYFRGNKRLIIGLGVENLVVIDSPQGLLVADKSALESIKESIESQGS